MGGESRYLSKSEFASAQGWSPSYVTKLKNQGRLVLDGDGKKVNVEATLAKLRETGDPGKEVVRQHHASERSKKLVSPSAASSEQPEVPASADPKYWENKARREGALAELAELDLARKQGELVDRKRVEAMAFSAGRILRDTVLAIPTRIAPELAAMTDPFEIEVKLRDALRQAFSDLTKLTAQDLDKLTEPSH